MSAPGFWDDRDLPQQLGRRRRELESALEESRRLADLSDEAATLEELAREGEEVEAELAAALDRLEPLLDGIEMKRMLTGENDAADAILSIHPGAGGTESQDWAEMLYRMYLRWAERHGFELEVLDHTDGDEAGLKSASLLVRGPDAYGLLRAEKGVHRLVRISPFDAAARRHTSFASVDAYPDLDRSIEIEIDEKDLRVDTFRSSGKGGQHVNVTDSAVRITHLPTKIVVQCQNERSQHRNREMAMKYLKARLYEHERQRQEEQQAAREGQKKEIGFGSQIRSYVLHPYRQVKDHRTGLTTSRVEAVLDGDLDPFIRAYLLSASAA
jgi:peptide chain release factor 2